MYRRWSRRLLLAAVFLLATSLLVSAANIPRMSTDDLKSRLGEPGLVVLDSRSGSDWERASQKIVGAVRVDPRETEKWAGDYSKEQTIVLYCN